MKLELATSMARQEMERAILKARLEMEFATSTAARQ
jgi:hypothetical protein